MKVYRDIVVNGTTTQTEIFDIAECTYSGKDMGERSITANIKWATPIDFKIGDYVVLQMQTLIRSTTGVDGNVNSEKFYLYTMPTIKKNASPMSSGQAFEHTVTFYPAQYELGLVQMRDCGQEQANVDTIIYTGFDSLSFVGGADELMRRIMAVLKEAYHDTDGNPLWSYKIADAVNENKNTALERVSLSFSGNSVMDALLKLNDEEGLNTTFFINGRTIYVGYKRPYFCRVTDGGSIDTAPSSQMFQFQYGKTSHQPIALGHGGLYQITKALGKESPITKLFAYGAARNLNRYYCSDRIQSGRYVNRLMLPSFDADGKTDYILSEDSIKKYGIREGSKQFEEIYPSLRYITYGDLRQIKYCIKIKSSGIANDKLEQGNSAYPVARVQCYKVVPSGKTAGINKLVEAAPPDDLCVIVHAMGKTVKAVLYGGNTDSEAITKQRQHDTKVPTRTANGADYIPGSCFLVHDRGFDSNKTYQCTNRSEWFSNPNSISSLSDAKRAEINMNQIQYEDTFWLSDLYVFEGYSQTHFSRDGYSAWAWPRTTIDYQGGSADSTIVNEVAAVEPIVIEDTSSNVDDLETQQKTFDIYLKDVGFKIDEQNDFGDMVFVVGTELKISMLDGLMAGREFTAAAKVVDNQYTCICAYNEDGSLNNDFFMDSDYNKGDTIPRAALAAGAIWRICCNRINLDEADYSNLNLILPTKDLCVKKGDHLVFLDIYMPDIYIHAAENRLLREARKYLNANDNGSVSYSAQFDKVRLQQIPNYALQMREGLNIRMVDDDLEISTDNDGRYLSNYGNNPLYSSIIINTNGASAWLSSNDAVDFTKGRFYTFTCYIKDNASLATNNALALFSVKNDGIDAAKFLPTYSLSTDKNKKSGYIHLTFKFELPSNFNDDVVYYPSLQFKANNNSSIGMWVESVYEKDYADGTAKLNYADFTIDSLTIKITNSNSNTAPIREITATFSENPAATAWATLMSNIENTRITGEQSEKAIEALVNTARKNYQTLLNLRNSIFDPDGTCDQTFLQVMMMQVGADSMNYQLDKTRTGLSSGGQQVFHNCKIEKVGSNWHFKVTNADTLRHYVYTQGAQGGTWAVTGGLDQGLDGASNYFICLRCSREGNAGEWVCSTKQYAANDTEDTNSWFFNWGILTVDGGGNYTLVETRGNAYMYGDNLVCGKISTLAGNSYFDLNNGDFVLSNGAGKALSYENGILTIGGVNDESTDSILARLGITEGVASNAQSAADSAKEDAAAAKTAADNAKSVADAATTRLNNWAADGVISPVEKQGIKDEIARIDADKSQITTEYTKYSLDTPTAFNTAYTDYRTKLEALSAAEPENINIPSDFSTKQTAYYTARTTALNAISTKADDVAKAYADEASASAAQAALDNLEIGGRNLILLSDGSSTTNIFAYGDCYTTKVVNNYDGGTGSEIYIHKSQQPDAGYTWEQSVWIKAKGNLELDTDYVLSFDARLLSSSSFTSVLVYLRLAGTPYDTAVMKKVEITKTLQRFSVVLHSHPTDPYNYATLFIGVPTTIIYISKVQLEKGNKATDWTPAPEDVEASIAENKTYADGIVKALGDTLQSQIDGVVDSYFMEGVPTTSNAPANEWTADELKQRHEGDTYTNIQQYTKLEKDVWEQGSFAESKTGYGWVVNGAKYDTNKKPIRLAELMENKKGSVVHLSDYSTYKFAVLYFDANKKLVVANFWKTADFVTADYPYIAISVTRIDGAQTSIADVVASGVVINPDAGKSWRWCKGTGDSPATGWHWHEIADSDAVRALQNAAKAQDTADKKRRVFVVQPTPPYEIGDLWAQGDGDGKDILKCKTAKTAGQTFAQDDWEAASSALTKAGQAATEAATAKANAQTALTTLTNIASDNIFTKQEKCSVRTEWASIQAEFAKNTNNAKVCWGESGYTSNTEYAAYKTAYDSLNSYLTNTAKLSANEDTTIVSATFNKNFSDYYGANVTLLNAIAKRVSEIEVAAMSMGTRNLFAKKYMLDWNAKSAGTTTVNFDDYGEYYQIKENQVYTYVGGGESYNDILQGNVSFETSKQYCLKVKWRVDSVKDYDGLYLGFKYSDGTRNSWIVCAKDQTTPIEATLVSASGKTVAGIVCSYGTWANTRIYEIQLTEGNKAPSGWAEAEADKETGGENLYTGDNPLTITANATNNYNYATLVKNLQNDARYVFSCGKSVVKAGSTDKYAVLLYDFNASSATQTRELAVGTTRVEQAFTIPSTGTWSMLIYSGVNGSTAGISMEFTDIMVQKGNRATEYQKPIRKFLYNGNISISYKSKDYAQSKLLASGVYAGTYYAEMTSESKGAGIAVDNRDAFQNSCLVWFAAGHQNKDHLFKITDWGEAVNISQRADVYVYTGQAAFIKDYTQDPTSFDVKFKADGTWTINGAQISAYTMEYLSGEAYEAKSKAEALDYLKAAIADGDTEVAGGLLLTNVLMLRDMDKNVTAGMSGLTTYKPEGSSTTLEDLVLLWGGGTYDEAFYAARNADYKKSTSGDPITTLLKKDGTGKIGIFKISDTQAIIDVPNQGKVVIDASTANGGIFIKDNSGIDKVVISPLSLNSFGSASTHYLGKVSILKNVNETEDKDLSGSVSYSQSFTAGKTGTLESSFDVLTEMSASVMINSGKGYPSATSGYNTLYVTIRDTTSNVTVFSKSLASASVSANANNTTSGDIQDSKYDSKTYNVSINIQVVKGHNYTLSVSGEAIVRGNIGGTPSSKYDAEVHASLSITSNGVVKLLYTDMCAYLCVDGMSVAANSELKFDVMKSGTNLKVLAKGLPTTSSGLTAGQLYNSGGTLKIYGGGNS